MSTKDFVKKYWTQIDLHSHTLHGIDCKGKTDYSKYNHYDFLNAILKAGTQLQAVTNHNTFILEDHIKQAILCGLVGIGYVPGVEIDVRLKGKEKPFQCVFLLCPKNDICFFSNCLNAETNNKKATGEVFYNEEEISKIFTGMHFIYVVHGIKKKGLAESEKTADLDRENIDWVCKAIKNASAEPILFENNRPQNIFAFSNRFKEFTGRLDLIDITQQQVTTSDYKFDNDEERLNRWLAREKFAINAEPTYEGLELSIRHYKNRFQLVSEIVEPVSFIESFDFVKRKDNKFSIEGTIECSPYFNVIIGNSGSGKTLLLNELYRSVTTPSANLNAVLTKDNFKKTNNGVNSVYEDYIGKKKSILVPRFFGTKPVVVEIDKIYKLLLNAEDPTEIASLFNVTIPSDVNSILIDYQERLFNYESVIKNIDSDTTNGQKALDAIYSNYLFINSNSVEGTSFLLKRTVFDSTIISKLKNKINEANQLKQDKEKVDEWIKKARTILPDSQKSFIDDVALKFSQLASEIDKQIAIAHKELQKQTIDKTIADFYNRAVESVGRIIGNKQAEVDKANSTILEQGNDLRECIKSVVSLQAKKQSFDLSYPFEKIAAKTESSQSNNKARVFVDYLEKDQKIEADTLLDNRLIDTTNIQTKIKSAIKNNRYSLKNSDDVKQLVFVLYKAGLSFATMINETIPFITQIKDDGVWKNALEMNPGNLAKSYMTYYFQSIIDTSRPNVVFIDQPENDVDKSFISDVLASFISKHKKSVQFFITSHEPILGVNADSNLIIEAFRNSGGAISYRAKPFESTACRNNDESGVQVASRILDGGKDNVIKRNQIYGGSIDD